MSIARVMLVLNFLKIDCLGGLQYFGVLHLKMHEITSHTAENLSLSQNRKSAQKGAKRRQKAQKGDFMAEKGARMAPKGVKRRILAPFDAFWRIGKKHSVL